MPAFGSPEFTSISTPEVTASFLLSLGTNLLDLDALTVAAVDINGWMDVKTRRFWSACYGMETLQEFLHLLRTNLLVFQEQDTSRRDCGSLGRGSE